MAYKRLGDMLLDSGYITTDQLTTALSLQKDSGMRLGETLIDAGYITEKELIDVLCMQLGIDFIDLTNVILPTDLTQTIPKNMAKKYNMVPVKATPDEVFVAMSDPMNFIAQEEARTATRRRIVPMVSTKLAIERAIEYYRRKGYTEDWISQPLFSIRARKNLTFEWRERGVKTNSEYAILTNDIYHAWSDLTAREYKTFKGLANESLRDNMSDLELALSTLAEATTAEVERATDPESLPEHREVARSGGEVAGIARKAAEKKIGGPVITSATAPDFGRLIMEVIEVQAIEEEGDALNADAAE